VPIAANCCTDPTGKDRFCGATEIELRVGTVNMTGLLATPEAVTITFPVVAPVGTGTLIVLVLQLVGAPATPLNVTVPRVVPNRSPVMVTGVPTWPDVGERPVIAGPVTVNSLPLLATPLTVTTTFPVVALIGTGTLMVEAVQLVGVATVPLNLTMPGDAPKPEPVMVTDAPTTPEVGVSLVMLGAAAAEVDVIRTKRNRTIHAVRLHIERVTKLPPADF